MKLFLTFSLLCAAASGATLCVGPSATGSGSGADWSNIAAWSGTPSRSDTWYLEDGSYATKTLSAAAAGSTLITIKKATVADHGTSTGWSDTMGDGQAIFGAINFTTSYWVFDGQTGGGASAWNSGFGFKIDVTADATALIEIGRSTTVTDITIRHVEFQGKGSVSTSGGSDSNDAVAIWDGSTITVSYAWMHGIGRCPFFTSANGLIAEHVYVQSYFGSEAVHSEIASMWGFGRTIGNHTFRYCLFADLQSTGGLIWDSQTNASAVCAIYGNTFYKPSGATWGDGNGAIGGWTGGGGEKCQNLLVYNNDFYGINQTTLSTLPATFSGNVALNNIWYNCTSPDFAIFASHDYDYFINSGGSHSESNGGSAGSGDPFANAVALNFRLSAASAISWSTLGSPYNSDPDGVTRTSSVGAFQYVSGTTNGGTITYGNIQFVGNMGVK